MSTENPNWKRAEQNMGDFLESSRNAEGIENETKRALEGIKPKKEGEIGHGYTEVQRRRAAEEMLDKALGGVGFEDISQPRHPELLEEHIKNVDSFLADLKAQSEGNGFPKLRWDTFPGEEGGGSI